jgi:hypothetical protein
MKKLLILLLLLPFFAKAQTTYQLNYDSIRVNKTAGTGGTSLYGKVYLKNVGLGLVSDSILTVLNGRIRKIPVAGIVPTLGTSAISLGGTANGLSYLSGNYRLHKVTATTGGVLTTGADTIAGNKRFTNSGSDNTVNIDHTSGAGIGLTITKGGNGEGLIVNKTSGSGNAVTVSGGNTELVGLTASSASVTASNGLAGAFANNATSFETLRATNSGSGLIASFRNSGGEVASIGNSGVFTGSGTGLSGVVLTTTNQTGLAGNKSWTGTHTFVTTGISPTTFQALAVNDRAIQATAIDGEAATFFNNSATRTTLSLFNEGGGKILSLNNALILGEVFSVASSGALTGTSATFSGTGTFGTLNSATIPLVAYASTSNIGLKLIGTSTGNGNGTYFYANNGSALLGSVNISGTAMAISNEQTGILYFATSGSEQARISSSGDFSIGTSSGGFKLNVNGTGNFSGALTGTSGTFNSHTLILKDGSATASSGPFYGLADLVNTRQWLMQLGASPTFDLKFFHYTAGGVYVNNVNFLADGGIANYSANNVNLSDERTKKSIKVAGSYWDIIKAIEFDSYKYKNQKDGRTLLGVMAQQVEKINPDWVNNKESFGLASDGTPFKSVYENQLQYGVNIVVQESMKRIEALEAEVKALKSK